jgi:pimeloyl-ACP methyl ester carboxylesterase
VRSSYRLHPAESIKIGCALYWPDNIVIASNPRSIRCEVADGKRLAWRRKLNRGEKSMTKSRIVAAMAVGVLAATLGGFEAHAQPAAPVEARNVVLIHGAWADGSSWAEVIPRLQAAGLNVTAVQNPLTSLADSVAATRRALALQDGPTVLVAHSWGGTVLSETGIDSKVTALVYVAARAPDAGEDFVALSGKFPTGAVREGIQEHDGFTRLSEESFLKYFANGVEPKQAIALCRAGADGRLLVQRTNHGGCLALQTIMVRGIETRSDDQS